MLGTGTVRTGSNSRHSYVGLSQVADALADKDMPEWFSILGQRVIDTNWSCASSSHSMQASLLSLPVNVRIPVLQHAMSKQQKPSRPLTLGEDLPTSLHPHVVGAMIDDSGTLECPCEEHACLTTVLAQLPLLPSLGFPRLHSLDVTTQVLDCDAAHVLSQVLPFQAQLSCLQVQTVGDPCTAGHVVETLIPALAAATNLQSLKLFALFDRFPAETLSILGQCFSRLTSLGALDINGFDLTTCSSPEDSGYGVTEDELRWHLSNYLQATAIHHSLTSLRFSCSCAYHPLPWPSVFPRLLELCVSSNFPLSPKQQRTRPSAATKHAPWPHFPSLTKLRFSLHSSPADGETTSQLWLPFCAGSGSCPELRVLTLQVSCEIDSVADADLVLWKQVLDGAVSGIQCCVRCLSLDRAALLAALCTCGVLRSQWLTSGQQCCEPLVYPPITILT